MASLVADRLGDLLTAEIAIFFRDGATTWDFEELSATLARALREAYELTEHQTSFDMRQGDTVRFEFRMPADYQPGDMIYGVPIRGVPPRDMLIGHPEELSVASLTDAQEQAVLDDATAQTCATCSHPHTAHLHPMTGAECPCLASSGGCRCEGWVRRS